jgi:non-ribosomal peptide synthetase component F
LKRLSRENQATLYMTLLSAFGVLLSRYSGQDDVVVGSPIANRQEAQLEELIGLFLNTLVMRMRVKPEMSFRELLGQVRGTALDAFRHQDMPFERLVEELSPQRNLNTTPVFQVVFDLQNLPTGAARLTRLEVEPVSGGEPHVRTDLEVHAFDYEGGIGFTWLYNRDLFNHGHMDQMARHYVRVLDSVLADVDQPLHRLEMLGKAERYTLLEEFNATT